MRKASFPGLRGVTVVTAGLLFLSLLSPIAAYADGCTPSGTLFSCVATVTNVQVTVACPGNAGTRTGKIGSVTATVVRSTAAEAQAIAGAEARREAERIARDRAFAACGATPPANGVVSKIDSLTNGSCRTELGFFACEATASGTTVTASCDGRKRATGRLLRLTATSFASTIPQAQADARNIASAEAIAVATERALFKSCGRPSNPR